MLFRILFFIFIFLLFYSLIILLGYFDSDTENADYLIVLGHKLNNDCIDNVLRYRLRKTIKYLNRNNNTIVILSGGITSNNTISEAIAMKEYLTKNGIENKIILEDKSCDTIENIINCKKYIDSNSKTVLISSNYHVFRAKMICKMNGLKIKVIACYTPISELIKHLFIEMIFIPIHYFRIKKDII